MHHLVLRFGDYPHRVETELWKIARRDLMYLWLLPAPAPVSKYLPRQISKIPPFWYGLLDTASVSAELGGWLW